MPAQQTAITWTDNLEKALERARSEHRDVLLDFTSGTDRIDLSAIDAIAGTVADDAFTFIGTAAFSNQAGQLRFETVDGLVHIFGDVDGNGVADLHIMASGPQVLAGDFIF